MEEIGGLQRRPLKLTHGIVLVLVISLSINLILFTKIHNLSPTLTGAATGLTDPSPVVVDRNLQNEEAILHYKELRETLETMFKEEERKNIGIFVQDIRTGAWLGINEREEFVPASLLKVPIMLGILKKVDRGEIKLEDKIIVNAQDVDSEYLNVGNKKAGDEVILSELLKQMITNSDNTAKNILRRELSTYEMDAVFKHVGLPNPYISTERKTVSPRAYTRFFKTLYYSTFVSQELSERGLDLTTDTVNENLIPKGVPAQIQVAHKFGMYGEDLLHDCGIVYHSKNPYFICIMTKNIELERSSEIIKTISSETFNYVENH